MFIELESRAANRDVTLINEVPADLQLHANADAFEIALRNLLDNAIKHGASPGEVRVSARQCSPDFVELTIDDDGPGIPRDAHAQIPRRCTRLPGTLAPGSGLGLAIVARIAQLHRATLRFSQLRNRGLCVQLDWPTSVNSQG